MVPLDLEPALSEPVTLSLSSSESESVMILGASHSVFFLGINGDCLALESIDVFFFLLIKGELKNVLKSKANCTPKSEYVIAKISQTGFYDIYIKTANRAEAGKLQFYSFANISHQMKSN